MLYGGPEIPPEKPSSSISICSATGPSRNGPVPAAGLASERGECPMVLSGGWGGRGLRDRYNCIFHRH